MTEIKLMEHFMAKTCLDILGTQVRSPTIIVKEWKHPLITLGIFHGISPSSIRAKGLASDWMSNDVLNLSDSRSSPYYIYTHYIINI
jgi:hypothetical protein